MGRRGSQQLDYEIHRFTRAHGEGRAQGAAPGSRCYTFGMPTSRARHMITETDDVAQALRDAARRWPEDRERPAKLLLDLVREGHRAIVAETDRGTAERRAAIERTGGALTGVYPADYLERLRDDWPA